MSVLIDVKTRSDSAQRDLDKINDSLRKIEGSTTRLTDTFNAFSKGLVAVTAASGALYALGRISDQFTNFSNKLALVTGRTGELLQVQKELLDVTERTRGSLENTADIFGVFGRSLKGASVSTKQLVAATEAIQQAVQISGANAESARAAIVQLGQGLASGQLRGQELQSVMEQIPRVAKAISDELGVTLGQLRGLAEQGKITSDVVFRSILNQSRSIKEEFALIGPTLQQAFGLVRLAVSEFVNEMDKGLGISDSISRNLINISHNVRQSAQSLLVSTSIFASRVRSVVAGVEALAVPTIRIFKDIGFQLIKALPKAFFTHTMWGAFKEGLRKIDDATGNTFGNIARTVRFGIKDLFSFDSEVEKAIKALKRLSPNNWLTGGLDTFTLSRFLSKETVVAYSKALKDLFSAISGNTETFGSRVAQFIRSIRYSITDFLRFLGAIPDTILTFRIGDIDALYTTIAELTRGFTGLSRKIWDVARIINDTLGPSYDQILNAVKDIFKAVTIKDVLMALKELASAIFGVFLVVGQVIVDFWNGNLFDPISRFRRTIRKIPSEISSAFYNMPNVMLGIFGVDKGLFSKVASNVTEFVSKIDIGKSLHKVLVDFKENIIYTAKGLDKIFGTSTIGKGVIKLFDLLSKGADKVSDVLDSLISKMNTLKGAFTYNRDFNPVAFYEKISNSLRFTIDMFGVPVKKIPLVAVLVSLVASLETLGETLWVNIFSNTPVDKFTEMFPKLEGIKPVLLKVQAVIFKFAYNVIEAFRNIYDKVIGHSWWTDTVDSIVNQAEDLPSKALRSIRRFGEQVKNVFVDIFKKRSIFENFFSLDSGITEVSRTVIRSLSSGLNDFMSSLKEEFPNLFKSILLLLSGGVIQVLVPKGKLRTTLQSIIVASLLTTGTLAAERFGDNLFGNSFISAGAHAIGIAIGEGLAAIIRTLPNYINGITGIISGFFSGFVQQLPIIGGLATALLSVASMVQAAGPLGLIGGILLGYTLWNPVKFILGLEKPMDKIETMFSNLSNFFSGKSGGIFFQTLFGTLGPTRVMSALALFMKELGAFDGILAGSTILDLGLTGGLLAGILGGKDAFIGISDKIKGFVAPFFLYLRDAFKKTALAQWNNNFLFDLIFGSAIAGANPWYKTLITSITKLLNDITTYIAVWGAAWVSRGWNLLNILLFGKSVANSSFKSQINTLLEFIKKQIISLGIWLMSFDFIKSLIPQQALKKNLASIASSLKGGLFGILAGIGSAIKSTWTQVVPPDLSSKDFFIPTGKGGYYRDPNTGKRMSRQKAEAMAADPAVKEEFKKNFGAFATMTAASSVADMTKGMEKSAQRAAGKDGIMKRYVFGKWGVAGLLAAITLFLANVASASEKAVDRTTSVWEELMDSVVSKLQNNSALIYSTMFGTAAIAAAIKYWDVILEKGKAVAKSLTGYMRGVRDEQKQYKNLARNEAIYGPIRDQSVNDPAFSNAVLGNRKKVFLTDQEFKDRIAANLSSITRTDVSGRKYYVNPKTNRRISASDAAAYSKAPDYWNFQKKQYMVGDQVTDPKMASGLQRTAYNDALPLQVTPISLKKSPTGAIMSSEQAKRFHESRKQAQAFRERMKKLGDSSLSGGLIAGGAAAAMDAGGGEMLMAGLAIGPMIGPMVAKIASSKTLASTVGLLARTPLVGKVLAAGVAAIFSPTGLAIAAAASLGAIAVSIFGKGSTMAEKMDNTIRAALGWTGLVDGTLDSMKKKYENIIPTKERSFGSVAIDYSLNNVDFSKLSEEQKNSLDKMLSRLKSVRDEAWTEQMELGEVTVMTSQNVAELNKQVNALIKRAEASSKPEMEKVLANANAFNQPIHTGLIPRALQSVQQSALDFAYWFRKGDLNDRISKIDKMKSLLPSALPSEERAYKEAKVKEYRNDLNSENMLTRLIAKNRLDILEKELAADDDRLNNLNALHKIEQSVITDLESLRNRRDTDFRAGFVQPDEWTKDLQSQWDKIRNKLNVPLIGPADEIASVTSRFESAVAKWELAKRAAISNGVDLQLKELPATFEKGLFSSFDPDAMRAAKDLINAKNEMAAATKARVDLLLNSEMIADFKKDMSDIDKSLKDANVSLDTTLELMSRDPSQFKALKSAINFLDSFTERAKYAKDAADSFNIAAEKRDQEMFVKRITRQSFESSALNINDSLSAAAKGAGSEIDTGWFIGMGSNFKLDIRKKFQELEKLQDELKTKKMIVPVDIDKPAVREAYDRALDAAMGAINSKKDQIKSAMTDALTPGDVAGRFQLAMAGGSTPDLGIMANYKGKSLDRYLDLLRETDDLEKKIKNPSSYIGNPLANLELQQDKDKLWKNRVRLMGFSSPRVDTVSSLMGNVGSLGVDYTMADMLHLPNDELDRLQKAANLVAEISETTSKPGNLGSLSALRSSIEKSESDALSAKYNSIFLKRRTMESTLQSMSSSGFVGDFSQLQQLDDSTINKIIEAGKMMEQLNFAKADPRLPQTAALYKVIASNSAYITEDMIKLSEDTASMAKRFTDVKNVFGDLEISSQQWARMPQLARDEMYGYAVSINRANREFERGVISSEELADRLSSAAISAERLAESGRTFGESQSYSLDKIGASVDKGAFSSLSPEFRSGIQNELYGLRGLKSQIEIDKKLGFDTSDSERRLNTGVKSLSSRIETQQNLEILNPKELFDKMNFGDQFSYNYLTALSRTVVDGMVRNLAKLEGTITVANIDGNGELARTSQLMYDSTMLTLQNYLAKNAASPRNSPTFQAGQEFASNVFTGIRNGMSEFIRGRMSLKDSMVSILDSITNTILDTFINGMMEGLAGKDGILSKAVAFLGGEIFNLGKGTTGDLTSLDKDAALMLNTDAINALTMAISGNVPGKSLANADWGTSQYDNPVEPTEVKSPELNNGINLVNSGLTGLSNIAKGGFSLVTGVIQMVVAGIQALIMATSTASLSGGGGGGFLGMLGGIFKGISAFTPGGFASVDSSIMFSKGGIFGNGISAFSNSVVSSPTLFRFANGTGLMGEAGPEAIMPLVRGSDGKLGVSARGSNEQKSQIFNINITGDVSRQTRNEIQRMIPQIAGGVNQYNYESGYGR